jgi:hypothetical protein
MECEALLLEQQPAIDVVTIAASEVSESTQTEFRLADGRRLHVEGLHTTDQGSLLIRLAPVDEDD